MQLAWLPTYMVREQKLSFVAMGMVSGAVYLLQAGMAVGSGAASDALLRRGGSATLARKVSSRPDS